MRILYGVTGEGMGHATRSKVTIEYLIACGHQVKVVASNRAYVFLARDFDTIEIKGLELQYQDGAVDLAQSLLRIAQSLPEMMAMNAPVYTLVEQFAPEIVFSDFESFAYFYAKGHSLPIISIDNGQMIDRCEHPPQITAGVEGIYKMADVVVNRKLPLCDYYVITTFFYPQIRPQYQHNTVLIPPILRDVILAATPTSGSHVLVYQTSVSDTRLLDILNEFQQQQFIVYGLRRDAIVGNCVVKNFSEDGFVADLASCKAVLANGGMSLLGEALYMGKPVYSVPVRQQFEQIMNARYLAALGYGLTSEYFDPDVLDLFLCRIPSFTAQIMSVPRQNGNEILYHVVDQLL